MNYKHIYHAGNFADVIKHILLIALIESLKKKDSPFCYIDTHAGAGYYDLTSDLAMKTAEFNHGIEKILGLENPPPLIQDYVQCVHDINNQLSHEKYASLSYYPGSPLIAHHFLRPQDRIVACELHPEVCQSLRQTFASNKQVAVHHMDGFLGLKAHLPPKEKRGLILIDPPYEDPDEFAHLAHMLPLALKRFPTGVYAIWYPIKEKSKVDHFYQALKTSVSFPVFSIDLTIYPDLPNHLNGCGLAVINPPWQFDDTVQQILPRLWNALTINNQGDFSAFWRK